MSNATADAVPDTRTVTVLGIPSGSYMKGTTTILGLLTIVQIILIVSAKLLKSKNSKGAPTLQGPPFIGHWRFFSDRYTFVNDGLRKLGEAFQFKVINHTILAVSGERARNDFLNTPLLNFREGYNVLFGAQPTIKHLKVKPNRFDGSDVPWFSKQVVSILRRDRLQRMISRIFEDIRVRMKNWGPSGTFDPMEDIYDIVFQLTVRASSSTEIANDPAAVQKLKECLQKCEKAANPVSLLLSWLPSKGRTQRRDASKQIYMMFKKVLDERKATGHREDDPTQTLIDDGATDSDIVEFSMITLFAGVANTGIMAAWLLMYISVDPAWKKKVREEVEHFINKYAPHFSTDSSDAMDNLASQLTKVPSSVWEDEMELTDLCLRETMRLVQSSVFLRRNITQEAVDIGGYKVASGDFVAYPTSDVHHNPAIYEDPTKFDPTRHIPKGEEKTPPFLGWGAGRHPCLGMRFAKLEVKWIVAMFLTAYDYDVVNENGTLLRSLPEPNHDNIFDRTKRPDGEKLFIKYHLKATDL